MYDFDTFIDRRGTGAVKTDVLRARFGREDILPLWVADMDLPTPDFIIEALKKRLDHPILGYTATPQSYWPLVAAWQRRLHGWDVDPAHLTFIPGIVKGIALALQYFTRPGDKVLIQEPVYMPFRWLPERNGRLVVNNPLKEVDGRYEMDLDHLESCIQGCKVLILCNPHNPGGRVWDQATLARLAEICLRHKVLVISDEIHADMALTGHRHHPFATVSEAAAQNSLTFAAPSKTFNIPGIVSSFCAIPNPELRERFFGYLEANEFNAPTFFALEATAAAFTDQGYAWRGEMLRYIEANWHYLQDRLQGELPCLRPMEPQASFLVWLDCRALSTDPEALDRFFIQEAGLALNNGRDFGADGTGFMRLNIACPRSVLARAIDQIREALDRKPVI